MPSDVSLADLDTNPDEILAGLRATEPVCWVPSLEMWLVTKWDDVVYMEDHPELFSAATEPSFLARALGANMLTSDPPDHTRIQKILAPPFRPGGRSGSFVSEELVGMADGLLDLITEPAFDIMSTYAQPLSAGALATVLGLDGYGFDKMWAWCDGLCTDLANFEDDPDLAAVGAEAKADLGRALQERLDSDVVDDSALSYFKTAGASTEEIVNNVRLMISGGINEPRDGIGMVAWVMLGNPELKAVALTDSRSMRRLIEEVFRLHSPIGTITRQATTDVEIGGVAIPAGDLVSGVLRSINLDEDHWSNPTEIDLSRREGGHAAFGLGAHRCLGEWLGRQVVRVGVERLFARYPDLKLDEGHDVEIHGFEFRGPKAVQVVAN